MSELRNQLIDIMAEHLPHPSDEEYADAADAIIAALPDMVKPLEWDQHPDEDEHFGGGQDGVTGVTPYYIAAGGKGRYFVEYQLHKIRDFDDKVIWHDTVKEAKAAAQAHHIAAILSAFGVQGGEA